MNAKTSYRLLLIDDDAPRTFDNTMLALEAITERLEHCMRVVSHLESVTSQPELREALEAERIRSADALGGARTEVAALERRVALARRAVGLGLSLREQQKRGVRRPLASMTVASPDADVRAAIEAHAGDLRAELNVREVKVAADDGGLVTVSAKANFKVLGRRLGKKMKTVAAGVAALDEAAVQTLLDGGSVEVAGETLAGDDVLVTRTPREGQVVESDSDFTVVLDMNVPEALEPGDLALERLGSCGEELTPVVERDGLAAALHDVLVHDVEHLEK